MCDRVYHITGFGCTGEVCTNSQCEKGQCTVPKRLIHGLNISHKELIYLLQKSTSHQNGGDGSCMAIYLGMAIEMP